jgi:hypothetical protein
MEGKAMTRHWIITYFADRELLGLVSDEDFETFKDLLLESLHKEWPTAAVTVDDGEHAYVELDVAPSEKGVAEPLDAQSRADVETRVVEIANEVIDGREWATEEFEEYEEDVDEDFKERDYDEERDDS